MLTRTGFPFIGIRNTDYLPKGKAFRLFLQNCLHFHSGRYKYPRLSTQTTSLGITEIDGLLPLTAPKP